MQNNSSSKPKLQQQQHLRAPPAAPTPRLAPAPHQRRDATRPVTRRATKGEASEARGQIQGRDPEEDGRATKEEEEEDEEDEAELTTTTTPTTATATSTHLLDRPLVPLLLCLPTPQ